MKVQLRAYGKAQTAAIPGYCEAKPGLKQSLRTACAWRGTGPVALRGLQGLQRRHRYEDALSCFVISVSPYQCSVSLMAVLIKPMRLALWLGAHHSDTRGIARMGNDAKGAKARFYKCRSA
jgi:hypothetical protein